MPDAKTLPIRDYATRIADAVKHNSVTIVIGETGSGKTTQISQVPFPLDLPFICCVYML